jgi:PKD domain.
VGDTITLDASPSSDPDRDITSYDWVLNESITKSGSVVETTVQDYGTYEATLTVEDSVGNTSTITKEINVTAVPEPEIEYTPSTPTTSDSIQFDASSSSDPDGSIQEYVWEFGDGDQATGETAENMYSNPGDYEVMLTVRDDTGNIESVTTPITVLEETGTTGGGDSSGDGGEGNLATQEERQEVITE